MKFLLCCSYSSIDLASELAVDNTISSKADSDTELKLLEISSIKNTYINTAINRLHQAESDAQSIIAKAMNNRQVYLDKAKDVAYEIVKPYYDLASEEITEIETSLNKELHIKSLEDIARKLDYNEEDISSRKECAASYLLSQVCTVQFSIDNPNFIHKYVNEPLKLRSTSIKDKLKNRSKGKKTSSAISYISSTSNNFLSKSVSNISKILN
ncbi:hypothetical protein cand_023170 [Cryptosporidium andersoni]|uniref:Uncharacterized protein n=1 Tax=Cryptosporidium andersoni TaxID=117008 RepID=A0A1J4MS17_9CRYT|nr:hypothetical protein cand_023170 [Cryptosporidium andersoni]